MSGRLTGVATAGNDALGVAGGTLSGVPVLILAPSQTPVAGIRFATAATLKTAYDAAIAAGSVPDIYIDGSASGSVVAWDAAITLDPRTTISGRNTATLDELDVTVGMRPGVVRFLHIVSKRATAIATLGAETLEIILKDGATLRNDGTGAASAPMFDLANAAAVLDVHIYGAGGLRTGVGGTADVVAKPTIVGATLNVHGYDSATVQATTLAAILATNVNYHKHSAGVSFSATQAGILVTPGTTIYSNATQVQMSSSDTTTAAARVTGLPKLIIDINPDVQTAAEIDAMLSPVRDDCSAATTIQPWGSPPYGNAYRVKGTAASAWWIKRFVVPVPASYQIEYEISTEAAPCGVIVESVDANNFIFIGSDGATHLKRIIVGLVNLYSGGAVANGATQQTLGLFGGTGGMLRAVLNVRAQRGSAGVYGTHQMWPNAWQDSVGECAEWFFEVPNGTDDTRCRYGATIAQVAASWQGVNNVCGLFTYDLGGAHAPASFKRIRVYDMTGLP